MKSRPRATRSRAVRPRFKEKGEPRYPHESLADFAYRAIEQLILSGELAPGIWVTESRISTRLGISRTPVREAIRRLMHARLVEVVPRKGMKITSIDYVDQTQLLEFRRYVERFVTMRAARLASPADAQQLRELAREMEERAGAADATGYFDADLRFKFFLINLINHPYAENAIHPLWAGARRFSWITRGEHQLRKRASLTAHLARTIAAGDVKAVQTATDAYIDHSIDSLRQNVLKGVPFPR